MSNSLPADMLTATDQIYLSLWNQICSLDLLPGEKLSEVRLAAGAGFVVVICGNIMTMPGLPKKPAAVSIDVDADGKITGLF